MLENPSTPKLQFYSVRKILFYLIVISGIFSAGYVFGFKGYKATADKGQPVTISRENPESQQTLNFSLFWRVWDTLDAKYFDKAKIVPSKMVYGAIQGMVSALGDPYTVFLPPTENKVVQEDLSGSFEGVGIQIGFKGSQLAVISPLPGSPGEKAGVKAGDFIIGITDINKNIERGTVGITLPEAVQTIRGPKGSIVTLTLLRDGSDEALVVDVVRDSIDVPSIVTTYVGENENVLHVQLLKFSSEMLNEWEDVVIDILKKPEIAGIVIDVRNNPGGFLQGAVDLASEFLDTGMVVVSEVSGDGRQEDFKVERIGRLKNQEVIILINGGSASASEIFAGALRDQKGTLLIGETTFGKGTIQEPQQIDNGAGLHITIAKWITPAGTWVNDGGLEPDVTIEDDLETSEDEQLQEAINTIFNN